MQDRRDIIDNAVAAIEKALEHPLNVVERVDVSRELERWFIATWETWRDVQRNGGN